MIVFILASGSSEAYHLAGSPYPKNLVEIAGKPLLQHVTEWLLPLKNIGAQFVFLIPKMENDRFFTASVIRLIDADAQVIEVPNSTGGAACTALLAIDAIDPESELLIVNGDIVIDCDPTAIVKGFSARSLDAGAVIFEGIHPRWSYVRLDEHGFVIEAAEKRPISRHATAGVYWFAKGAFFVDGASAMLLKHADTDGAFYLAPVFNELVLQRKSIGVTAVPAARYHSFKDPTAARRYEMLLETIPEPRQ
jgi:NDP-sugar pyrophosphorylase family protein